VAELIKVNQSTVVRLEQGKFPNPSAKLLERLSEELDLDLAGLYQMGSVHMPELAPYLRASYGLSDTDTAQVLQLVEQLARQRYGANSRGRRDRDGEQPKKKAK